jgi:hypothetical protein
MNECDVRCSICTTSDAGRMRTIAEHMEGRLNDE